MPWVNLAAFVAGNPLPAQSLNDMRGNFQFLHDQGADLAAAATITPTTQFHKVTGNTQINNVTILAAGARIMLWFTGTPVVKHNNGGAGSLILQGAANYTTKPNDVLEFLSDGTSWYQVGAAISGAGATSELAFAQFTAPVTITGATEATATTVVTASAFTADGSSFYIVEFWAEYASAGGLSSMRIALYQDGSSIGIFPGPAGFLTINPIYIRRRLAPAAGSRTFSVRAYGGGGGSGQITADTGGSGKALPGYIRVTRA